LKIAVCGVGYAVLVTGARPAGRGHEAMLVNFDASKITLLKAGSIPIYGPGVVELQFAEALA
jgi:UDPglucose 6-dehydrogenase